jgi:hypothetical protein
MRKNGIVLFCCPLLCACLAAQNGPTSLPRIAKAPQFSPMDSRQIDGVPIAEFVSRYEVGTQAIDIPPGHSDAQIGRGYDSATNEIKDQCVVFNGTASELVTVLPDPHSTDAQQLDFKMTHTTDGEELLNTLSIDASASFGWGAFSGNATVSYATSKKISRFGEYLLINETVENVTRFLKSTALTPAANKVRKDPFKFRQMCGDQFIVGVVTGGSFSAILNASSSSEDDQTSAKATFSAAAYGNKLDVQTVSNFKDLVTHGRLDITILRQGPNDNVPTDLDAIKAYAEALPGKVKPTGGTPWPILMTTKGYGALGPVLTGKQGLFLDAAGAQYMRLNRLSGGLEYIASHQGLFGGFDQNKYIAEHDSAEQAARLLAVAAQACSTDSTKCPTPAFTRPRELPERIAWVAVDPKTNGWTEIARVQGSQNRVAEARGQYAFFAGAPPAGQQEWYPASGGNFLIHNSNTGADQILQADRVYPIADFSTVSFRIWDSYYADNRSRPDDPLRAAVYTPVYSTTKGLTHQQKQPVPAVAPAAK